jgi:hypothetical protein
MTRACIMSKSTKKLASAHAYERIASTKLACISGMNSQNSPIQVLSKEIFWSLLMYMAGDLVAKKIKIPLANFAGRNCKTFPSRFCRPTEFHFFSIVNGISKKHKLAYFIQLIAKRYKAYIRQKLEKVKKVFVGCKHRPLCNLSCSNGAFLKTQRHTTLYLHMLQYICCVVS